MQRKQILLDQHHKEFDDLLKVRSRIFLSDEIAPSEKHRQLTEIGKRIHNMLHRSGHLAEQNRVAKGEYLDPEEIRFFGSSNMQSRL